jgi:hypothetical protein
VVVGDAGTQYPSQENVKLGEVRREDARRRSISPGSLLGEKE